MLEIIGFLLFIHFKNAKFIMVFFINLQTHYIFCFFFFVQQSNGIVQTYVFISTFIIYQRFYYLVTIEFFLRTSRHTTAIKRFHSL